MGPSHWRSPSRGVSVALLLASTITACSSPPGPPPESLLSRPGTVAGSVSSGVLSGDAGPARQQADNQCAAQAFSVFSIGGGGQALGTGTVGLDGSFTVTWNEVVEDQAALEAPAEEIVVVFSCATGLTTEQRCIGRPGDTQLACDLVSNTIGAALEDALGEKVDQSDLFKGFAVSKVVAGMVETLKLLSKLDPSKNWIVELVEAASLADAKAILASSPVGNLFQTIQTLAGEARARNLARQRAANVDDELRKVWTAEAALEFIVGLGLEIDMSLDDTGDHPGLYGPLSAMFDQASGTSFLGETQSVVYRLRRALEAGEEVPMSMACRVENQNGAMGNPISYLPDVTDLPLAPGSSERRLTCLGPTAAALGLVTMMDGHAKIREGIRLEARLGPVTMERSRNDRQGLFGGSSSEIKRSISLIGAFPELIVAVMPGGVCSSFYDLNFGEPMMLRPEGLAECVHEFDLGKYFSGALGIYRKLTTSQEGEVRVSLRDIYESLASAGGVYLTSNAATSGYKGELRLSDGASGRSWHFSTVLRDSGSTEQGKRVYLQECPFGLCRGINATVTTAEFEAMLATYRPSFDTLVGDFIQIPAFDELRRRIFTAAHHEDWNISGSRFFRVVGRDTSGDHSGDVPILCAFVADRTEDGKANPEVVGDFGPNTSIACEVATGTWEKGEPDGPTAEKYLKHFALQYAGRDGLDVYYRLFDRYKGDEFRLDGQNFRVLDVSLNPAPQAAADGLLRDAARETCYENVDSTGATEVHCYAEQFRYVTLSFPPGFYLAPSYWPFSKSMEFTSADGNTQQFQVAFTNQSTTADDPDPTDGFAVCLRRSGVESDASDPHLVLGVSLQGSLAPCGLLAQGGEPFYYLALSFQPGGFSQREAYQYMLRPSDGGGVYGAGSCTFPGSPGPQPCPVLVSLPDVESALGGLRLGPDVVETKTAEFSIDNPAHDARFDPYCYDRDGDLRCDCSRDGVVLGADNQQAATCTIEDLAGSEPTLSQPPVWGHEGQRAIIFMYLNAQCGALGGLDLANCLNDARAAGYDFSMAQLDWSSLVTCDNPAQSPVEFIDVQAMAVADVLQPNNYAMAGEGCGVEGATARGPVKLQRLVSRQNAYDVAKPETLLKLITAATTHTGTAVTIDPDEPLFSFPAAVALSFARLLMPPGNSMVKGPRPTGTFNAATGSYDLDTDPQAFIAYPDAQILFTQIQTPEQERAGSDVSTAILRAFIDRSPGIVPAEP